MESVDALINTLRSMPFVAWLVAVAVAVILIARFTDALASIHGFYQKVVGEKNQTEPVPEWRIQFEALRRNIIYCGISNNLPVHLSELRYFFIETGLIERDVVKAFHDRWLTNIAVAMGIAAVNVFSAEAVAEMKKELSGMQL